MNYSTKILLALLGVLLPSTLTFSAPLLEEARIISVVDGDTIVVSVRGKVEHTRLIGIDTPESRPNRRAELQSEQNHIDQGAIIRMGHEAANHARQLLPKKSLVRLEFAADKRDRYGRLLAYVWLSNGAMANEEIVRSGYAYLLTVPPNVRYRDRLALAFRDARSNNRGLWSSSAVSKPHQPWR
jgi:micrococcal nuclease